MEQRFLGQSYKRIARVQCRLFLFNEETVKNKSFPYIRIYI
jgi:hypothetical protein